MSTYLAKEIFDNLKASVQNEINWIKRTERAILEYGSDDYKPPAIAGALQQGLSILEYGIPSLYQISILRCSHAFKKYKKHKDPT